MKILVTGASGFIGAHLARKLLHKNHQVTVLLRPGCNLWRIQDIVPSLETISADLNDHHQVEKVLSNRRFDACIHLAWYTKPQDYKESLENLVWLRDTLFWVQKIVEKKISSRLIIAGTCFEYDLYTDKPLREDQRLAPETLYGASKASLFLLLKQLLKKSSLSFCWLRIFYPYGPGEHPARLIPSIINHFLNHQKMTIYFPDFVRDYIYVDDITSLIDLLVQCSFSGPLNVGSGQPTTLRDMVSLCAHLLGRENENFIETPSSPVSSPEPPYVCADTTLACTTLNWKPRYNLQAGLLETIAYWKKVKAHD